MSYILDALKKADRDRAVPRVPTLGTTHTAGRPSSRRRWTWFVATALGANLVVIAVVVRLITAGAHAGAPSATGAGEPTAAPGASTPAATPAESTLAAHAAPAASGTPVREPRAGDARSTRSALGDTESAAAVAERRAAPPGRDETAEAPAARRGRAQEDTVPPAGAAALAGAERDGSRAPRGAVTPGGSADLKLEVLVYATDRAARSAWINGQRYVEGQQVLDRFTVEQITSDAVVLASEGRRVVLRQ